MFLPFALLPAVAAEYDQYAADYDELETGSFGEAFGFETLRRELLSKAQGSVLEVAAGTGLNLPLYPLANAQISELVVTDLSAGMLQLAQSKGNALPDTNKASFQQLNSSQLSSAFGEDRFDTVVDTFSLCTMSEPQKALEQMAVVLKKEKPNQENGGLLLLEHTRSEESAIVGAYQDITEPFVTPLSKGCVWNMRVSEMVENAGLVIRERKTNLLGTVTMIRASKL